MVLVLPEGGNMSNLLSDLSENEKSLKNCGAFYVDPDSGLSCRQRRGRCPCRFWRESKTSRLGRAEAALAAVTDRAEKAEAALAVVTRERDEAAGHLRNVLSPATAYNEYADKRLAARDWLAARDAAKEGM
jgi:hypothetical protein